MHVVTSFDVLRVQLPDEGWARLTRHLDRERGGQPSDLRTPFYGAIDRKEIIEILETAISGVSIPSRLAALDSEEREKIGPFSIRLPWLDRVDTLTPYFGDRVWAPDDVALSRAVNTVKRFIPQSALAPLSLIEAHHRLPKNTNAGLPWMSNSPEYLSDYLVRAECP